MSTVKGVKRLKGRWVYRSLLNKKVRHTPFNDLQMGLGIVEFKKITGDQILDASLDMGDNYIFTIKGKIIRDEGGMISLKWRGEGIPGSLTEGWIYDYKAYLAPTWKKATDKTIILIGSVLRTVAHGSQPAGVTGTFYMVKLD
jgi:hypothetical protein